MKATKPDDTTSAEERAEEAAALIAALPDEAAQVQAANTMQVFRLGWKAHENAQNSQAQPGVK